MPTKLAESVYNSNNIYNNYGLWRMGVLVNQLIGSLNQLKTQRSSLQLGNQ